MATATHEQAESVAADVERAGKKLERAARKTQKDLARAERKAQKTAKREQKKLQAADAVEPKKKRKSGGLRKKAGLLLGVGAAAGAAYALRPTPEPPLTLVPDADEPFAVPEPSQSAQPESEQPVSEQPESEQPGTGRHAAPESDASADQQEL